jgi:hypothetical protein
MVYSIYYLLQKINRINNIKLVHKFKNVQKFIEHAWPGIFDPALEIG